MGRLPGEINMLYNRLSKADATSNVVSIFWKSLAFFIRMLVVTVGNQ